MPPPAKELAVDESPPEFWTTVVETFAEPVGAVARTVSDTLLPTADAPTEFALTLNVVPAPATVPI